MNFLEYLKQKNTVETGKAVITEAFKNEDVKKANELILSLFKKNVKGRSFKFEPLSTKVDSKDCESIFFLNATKDRTVVVSFNYLTSASSSEVYSIDFFEPEAATELLFGRGEAKTNLSIYTLGQSIACFLPIIFQVVNDQDYDISTEDVTASYKKIWRKDSVKEGLMHYGALPYKVYEGLSDETIEHAFRIRQGQKIRFDESAGEYIWEESEAEQIKRQKREEVKASWKRKGESEELRRYSIELEKEYNAIRDAVKGGARTKEDLEVALKKKIDVKIVDSKETKEAVKKFEEKANKDPKQAFKEMKGYVNTVLKGLQPGVILCGAPGIGKTYRVLQQLKANGYVNGDNLHIIKGKCTTRNLYIDLYKFQNKGEILLIDDADSLVGPKAPEDSINILKAALDSTADDEGRLITYRVSGKLLDDEDQPVPKEFYYRGGVIVITNYSVGQLDTAVRGRVFTQSLDFTTEQLLEIIKDIMPAIDPEHISSGSKIKAYDYLMELAEKGTDMEISIRSFGTCARLFEVCANDDDFTDDDAKSMIAEQMTNQALKSGKHF